MLAVAPPVGPGKGVHACRCTPLQWESSRTAGGRFPKSVVWRKRASEAKAATASSALPRVCAQGWGLAGSGPPPPDFRGFGVVGRFWWSGRCCGHTPPLGTGKQATVLGLATTCDTLLPGEPWGACAPPASCAYKGEVALQLTLLERLQPPRVSSLFTPGKVLDRWRTQVGSRPSGGALRPLG